jgi:HD-GYP domain-containing protein (c-di-GMP phosphodiesterase class II)
VPVATIHLAAPDAIADFIRSDRLRTALQNLASLAGADLRVEVADAHTAAQPRSAVDLPIRYRGAALGRVHADVNGNPDAVRKTADAIVRLSEHLLDREITVTDLAEALMTSFDEQTMFYNLLPNITTKLLPAEIGDVLVDETARTLNCRRVSLLTLNDDRSALRVLASRGLPPDVRGVTIPVAGTIAGRALLDDDVLLVNDLGCRPDLAELSRGTYESEAFAVVRVPLRARGEPLGVLTATERVGAGEFTSRDRKLLDGLSAIGASALLNCKLHTAINNQMMGTIRSLAAAVDAKDAYTHDHTSRVAEMSVRTAGALNITDPKTLREIELAGLLHDIGKIGIPDAVLCKAASLTHDEYEVIRSHVEIGAGIVEHVQGLESVARAILHHHERYDGLGYPDGLAGPAIPLASKIIAVVDAYDALTTDRPYRAAASHEAAIRELQRCAGSQFDATIVETFMTVIRPPQAAEPPTRGRQPRRPVKAN